MRVLAQFLSHSPPFGTVRHRSPGHHRTNLPDHRTASRPDWVNGPSPSWPPPGRCQSSTRSAVPRWRRGGPATDRGPGRKGRLVLRRAAARAAPLARRSDRPGPVGIVVFGIGGTGKTTLAAENTSRPPPGEPPTSPARGWPGRTGRLPPTRDGGSRCGRRTGPLMCMTCWRSATTYCMPRTSRTPVRSPGGPAASCTPGGAWDQKPSLIYDTLAIPGLRSTRAIGRRLMTAARHFDQHAPIPAMMRLWPCLRSIADASSPSRQRGYRQRAARRTGG
jgi:hypothetical protein